MRKSANIRKVFMALFALCLLLGAAAKTNAAEAAPGFTISAMNSSRTAVSIKAKATYSEKYVCNEVALYDSNKKLIDYYYMINSSTGYSLQTASISALSKNKLYYISLRKVRLESSLDASTGKNTVKIVGLSSWSGKKAFSTAKASITVKKKKVQLVVKVPKVKGIKYYKIYMSTKTKKGYKLVVKKLKPGKKITIKKFGKKSFKSGKSYYVRVVPVAKSGKCAGYAGINKTCDGGMTVYTKFR